MARVYDVNADARDRWANEPAGILDPIILTPRKPRLGGAPGMSDLVRTCDGRGARLARAPDVVPDLARVRGGVGLRVFVAARWTATTGPVVCLPCNFDAPGAPALRVTRRM